MMPEDKFCKNCSNCYDKRDEKSEVVVYLCTVSGIVVDEQVNCKGSLFVRKKDK